MPVFHKGRDLFASLFGTSRQEQYLTRYVLREYAHGRSLEEILDDPYIRNRSTPEERARLLDRPEVVAAIGEHVLTDLRRGLGVGAA